MNLKNDNGGIFRRATIMVSTVDLPVRKYSPMIYETCVFFEDESDVVETYSTASEAAQGHIKWCRKYGITP